MKQNIIRIDSSIDPIALFCLKKIGKLESQIPLKSSADGSCLYNAVSILLCGNESMKHSLRFKAFEYLAQNYDKLNSIVYRIDPATICSPTVKETMKDLASENGWGSHFAIIALSNVIGAPITVLYPAVCKNKISEVLSKTYNPKSRKNMKEYKIMWTNMNIDAFNTLQPCNHFVPLVDKDCLKFTNDGRGVKAEELWLLRPSTSLDEIDTTIRMRLNEHEEALKLGKDKKLQVNFSIPFFTLILFKFDFSVIERVNSLQKKITSSDSESEVQLPSKLTKGEHFLNQNNCLIYHKIKKRFLTL